MTDATTIARMRAKEDAQAFRLAELHLFSEDADEMEPDDIISICWALIRAKEQLLAAQAEAAVLLDKIVVESDPRDQVPMAYCQLCFSESPMEIAMGETPTNLRRPNPFPHKSNCPCHKLAPLAAAFLAEHERLKANQRTPRTVEVCGNCGIKLAMFQLSQRCGIDKNTLEPCPLRPTTAREAT